MSQDNNNLIKSELFSIEPCENIDFDNGKYKKLALSASQKSTMSMFVSQIPALISSHVMSNAYIMKCPDGITETVHLMQYTRGGVSNTLVNSNGTIVAQAPLYEINLQAAALGAFSVMSIATGQYFLTQINSEFKMLNEKIDDVLAFLYGDKKAELIAEINFTQAAYSNFSSIMSHDAQRLATLTNLQAAKKIAMKDIEFYIEDLDKKKTASYKNYDDFRKIAEEAEKIKDSLSLAMQLYITSAILESQYSQNYDTDYIENVKSDAIAYLDRWRTQIQIVFSNFDGQNRNSLKSKIPAITQKNNPEELSEKFKSIIDTLTNREIPQMRAVVENILRSSRNITEYYVSRNGDLYITE